MDPDFNWSSVLTSIWKPGQTSPIFSTIKEKMTVSILHAFITAKTGFNNTNWFSGCFVAGHLYQQYIIALLNISYIGLAFEESQTLHVDLNIVK